jgi:rare lipoprotein A (peptidoglycan hydrolase)
MGAEMREAFACLLVMFGATSCTTTAQEDRLPPTHTGFASGSPSVLGDPGALAPNEIVEAEKSGDTEASTREPTARQEGNASFYSDSFEGRKTATGARFTQTKLTAASLDLPLGTTVTVTNQENGKSVDVEVNDRGPYVDGRVIDLSKMAAKRIGIIQQGVASVTIEAKPSRQPTKDLKDAVLEKAVQSVSEWPPSTPRIVVIREPSLFDQVELKFP